MRFPDDCTTPRPGSIRTCVAFDTDHRSDADCPRSIEPGSAENVPTVGAAAGGGGGAGCSTAFGGGGGVGGGGFLQPEATQSVPLRLSAGNCYAVGAVAATDFAGGDLDMSLVDEDGRVFAAEIGPSPNPLLFHCAARDTVAQAILQAHEIRRPARFLLVLGEEHRDPVVAVVP